MKTIKEPYRNIYISILPKVTAGGENNVTKLPEKNIKSLENKLHNLKRLHREIGITLS